MKRYVVLLLVIVLGVLALILSHCGGRVPTNLGYHAASAPGYIHVTNGQAIGFYSPTGVVESVLSLNGSWGNTQPFAQNAISGLFYFGTNTSTSANSVIYLSGLSGGFIFNTLAASQIYLETPGASSGVAVSFQTGLLYVADSMNDVVTYLKSATLGYGIAGGASNSIFAAPNGLGASYINVTGNTVIVTETQIGSAYFMNASNGNAVNVSGGKVSLPLVNGSTGCNSASLVNEVQVNPVLNIAYILCGPSVVYINMGLSAPNYFFGQNLINSTFATTGISSPTDILYDSGDSTVIVVGGSKVISFDAQTGVLTNSVDLSVYNCGSNINLQGVAYSAATKQIYVTDTTNSDIYVLNSSSFALSTGTCSSSVFTTITGVPGPTKIGFF